MMQDNIPDSSYAMKDFFVRNNILKESSLSSNILKRPKQQL